LSGRIVVIFAKKAKHHLNFRKNQQYMNYLKLFLITLFFSIIVQSNAQDFLQTNGKAIVNSTTGDTIILRGMGLGGWMVQEGYMLQTAEFASPQHQIKAKIEEVIGTTNTELFYEKWLENHCRKADIDSLASWGFNSVRLPMHYNLYTLPIEDEPVAGENTWLDKGFEMTDSLISWCAANNMWVVLDLHAAPGGQGYDEAISDYDPSKPSLWESTENQAKTVALWKKLAERYVDEPWVAGYDLLNEVNWNLPGGTQLRNLYGEITTNIRSVDNNHIIFIEGNWFANDFTGLTPPWDDNMVYSPHKYWSINDQASIQWVLDLRDTYDIPLYLGESGENSNVWFRDAIRLLEDRGIGWAWWPMKKIEAIAGPLSIEKTTGYENLLNYWKGNGPQPTVAEATATLMDLTEKLKIENCFYQKDVIDAMFRQVYSDETKPFSHQTIPGIVYAADFDLGRNGFAYQDSDDANYHVSTGNFTAWNSGWAYRNDAVDLEPSADPMNSNGYGVGFTSTGEWIQYTVDVTSNSVYDVEVRIANGGSDGAFHFSTNGSDISLPYYVPNTGGYQNWETLVIPNVILSTSDSNFRLEVDEGGFNVGSFNFVEVGSSSSVATDYYSAVTLNDNTIQLTLNKPLTGPLPASPADLEIFINGAAVNLTSTQLDPNNSRNIIIGIDAIIQSPDVIKVSHTGSQILAEDGTPLQMFVQENVENTIAIIHQIPGRMEAEDFWIQSGVQTENTSDVGGGKNLSFLDEGDYMDYQINVAQSGEYLVEYRTASQDSGNGQVQFQQIAPNGDVTVLQNILFSPTGGWQTWETYGKTIDLEEGRHHIRIQVIQAPFNLNYIDFSQVVSTNDLEQSVNVEIFPNPSEGEFFLQGKLGDRQDAKIEVYDILGRMVFYKKLNAVVEIQEMLNLNDFEDGSYFVKILLENGELVARKLLKL